MIKKSVAGGIILLFLLVSIFPMVSSDSPTLNKTIYVDDDNTAGPWDGTQEHPYQHIQDGIDNVSDGDTIYVYGGIYYENIIINKTLNLIGENRNTTIIDGNYNENVVRIKFDTVSIKDFSIRNSSIGGMGIFCHEYDIIDNIWIENCNLFSNGESGIALCRCNNVTIFDCIIKNNTYEGIQYDRVTNTTITSCNISSSWIGISIYNSFQNSINNCSFSFNKGGIRITDSSDINLSDCILHHNQWDGIKFNYSSNNRVKNCEVYSNLNGIYFDESYHNIISDCLVYNNKKNVNLNNANYGNILSNLIITNGQIGINLFTSSSNLITNCNIFGNKHGISLSGFSISSPSSNNTVTQCNIYGNEYGILCEFSKNNNTFYHNNLLENIYNCFDEGDNIWDDGYPSGGNYYSDYSGIDNYQGVNQNISGSDGIGDIPYNISGGFNQDFYPLMELCNFTPFVLPNIVYVDDDFNSSVLGWNATHFDKIQEGIDNVIENGTVYVYNGTYYESVIIEKSINLIGNSKEMTNIVGYSPGYSTINVYVDNVSIEGLNITLSYGDIGYRAHNLSIINNLYIGDCIFYDNGEAGIELSVCNNSTIRDCIFYNMGSGIQLDGSSHTIITNCTIYNNDLGIYFYKSDDTIIKNNSIKNNSEDGIRSEDSYNCLIYHNNFINNSPNGIDDGVNFWDNGYPSGGNYWDDYTGTDTDGDGVGDSPYNIQGGSNQDLYPLGYFHPIANYTYAPSNPTTADVIYFTDTSIDPDGIIVNWTWDFDDGNIRYEQNPTHQYADDGTYLVNLTVIDDDSASNSIQRTIVVSNVPPDVDFTYTPLNPTDLDIIQFTDTSTDIDGYIDSWHWEFGDGDDSAAQNPTHQYADDGTYLVTLTVKDEDEATDSISKDVVVINVPPVANFSYIPLNPTSLAVIKFTDLSYDLDGHIVNWTWRFNDGTINFLQNPSHQYNSKGTYRVTLTIKDDDDATDSISIHIIVENIPPSKPTRPHGETSGKAGKQYAYSTSTTDLDGDLVYYKWDWGDETSDWIGAFSSGDTDTEFHLWDEEGSYEIKVKAKDVTGTESPWSDPLVVSMPKNKAISPFLLILERLIERFPILEQILQPIYVYLG